MRLAAGLLVLACASSAFAANVRTDRPRILLGNGTGPGTTPTVFADRCNNDASYKQRCQAALTAGGGLYPAINDAAGFVVNGDAARCANAYNTLQTVAADAPGQPDAHSFISNNGRTMLQLAVVRDWCDAQLSGAQKTWIEGKITGYADWVLGGMGGYALDVFHDDMNNVWNSVALAGLVLKGTAEDAKADSYLAAADAQWKNVIFPALDYEGDFWHEGFTYVQPAVGSAIVYALAWSIATDENVFQEESALYDGYIDFHAYLTRPDYTFAYFGDSTDNKQSIQLFTRPLVDMLTLGTGSTLGQAFSDEIQANVPAAYDYAGDDAYLMALFYDASKDGTATPRSTLPTSRWLSKGAADVAVMRSGWGKSDTFVYVSCGDYFGAHQHVEAGSFQIFKNAELTGSSGYYDNFETDHWDNYYSLHSVHANTIAVYQPGEFFPTLHTIQNGASANVNDGGQRPMRRDKTGTAFPNPDLSTYLGHKTAAPYVDTGDVKTFEQTSCHSYVACDVTGAYSSPGHVMNGNSPKVDEVARQFVYVPPDVLVIFDRVDALDATYEKRFLLQSPPSPQVSGTSYVLQNGGGTLYAQTLLPAGATANVLTNFTVEGAPHPPTTTGKESFGTRIEVVAPTGNTRDYFLHVIGTGASAPVSTVTEDASSATVTIAAPQGKYTLTFAKTGNLAGHLTSMDASGNVTCDEELGAQAQSPDGGVPGTDGGMPGDDAGTGGGGGGGCSCDQTGESTGDALTLAAVAGLLAFGRRRRARA
jgi:hypothetical protein